ncbi:Apolipoprotein n-acyltransferase [Mycena indigotica]|uniref:Apolipoprotein n-acyltransferase n=1 Tax=Mycena indigotica TaxID=2126181 RepID=A0A8H6T0B5_9AGAR|nr:Apolipoprotein n-acyltransferase [Mycena indigotica]KAF7307135.1 Apolipoprotein n-acyltransferase [Mycena indigotica]
MVFFAVEAEPFEESQGRRAQASQAELQSFYKEAQKGDLERKLSKRNSNSNSLWSRKSTKRSSAQPQQSQPPPPVPGPSRRNTAPLTSASATSLARPPPSISEHGSEWSDSVVSLPLSRSIIPDQLRELPSWYRDSAHYTTRYAMHNPVGPKWYKNHHLIPSSSGTRPLGRPPSVFSPSFPPMPSGDRGDDSRGMSRSPSKSPLPTPNSSQSGVADDPANMPRSRKTSQTAHDNVDLMDGSDPWGTAWHHESPYDVGKSNTSSPVSFDESPQATRSRTSSVTVQNRRKTVTPSPLSQSTSAVHLQAPDPGRPTRKLSKRRTVGIFGRHTASAPASPVEGLDSRVASPVQKGVAPSIISTETKKGRRGSVLGRIAKRFSLMKKPTVVAPVMEVVRQPSPQKRQPSPEKVFSPEPTNTSPVSPPFHQETSLVVVPPPEPQISTPQVEDDRSSISLDATYRMGKLMVANPDPGSAESTPIPREMQLPSETNHFREETADTLASTPELDAPRTQSPFILPQSPSLKSVNTAPTPGLVASPPSLIESPAPAPYSPEPASSPSLSSLGRPLSGPLLPPITPVDHQILLPHRSESPPPPTPLPKSPFPSLPIDIPVARQSSPTKASPTKASPTKASPTKASPIKLSSSPEKSSRSFNNDHRFERPISTIRQTVELPPVVASSSSSRRVPPPSLDSAEKTRPPSPKLPAVPFPVDYGPQPTPRPESMVRSHMTAADISPLSTSSMLANPPTPYNPDTQIPDDTESIPPPVPSKHKSRDPSPGQVAVTGRETETFRLVRSASGTVYASTETIRAAGEQWEVIESSKSKEKRRKGEKEPEPERKGRSERKRHSQDAAGSNSQTFPRSGSNSRAPIPEGLVREESPRKRDAKDRKMKLDKPQPAPPTPSRNLDRNPSNSARPISEIPAADMTQMRAREAYDMDRLWKARSVGGIEPSNFVVPPPLPSKDKVVDVQQLGVHGSSHTAFVMSAPFHQPPPIYHSMPPPPAPMAYANGAHRASTSLPPLSNPLPEPPRESSYSPAPLSTDYWGKHANATTAH